MRILWIIANLRSGKIRSGCINIQAFDSGFHNICISILSTGLHYFDHRIVTISVLLECELRPDISFYITIIQLNQAIVCSLLQAILHTILLINQIVRLDSQSIDFLWLLLIVAEVSVLDLILNRRSLLELPNEASVWIVARNELIICNVRSNRSILIHQWHINLLNRYITCSVEDQLCALLHLRVCQCQECVDTCRRSQLNKFCTIMRDPSSFIDTCLVCLIQLARESLCSLQVSKCNISLLCDTGNIPLSRSWFQINFRWSQSSLTKSGRNSCSSICSYQVLTIIRSVSLSRSFRLRTHKINIIDSSVISLQQVRGFHPSITCCLSQR